MRTESGMRGSVESRISSLRRVVSHALIGSHHASSARCTVLADDSLLEVPADNFNQYFARELNTLRHTGFPRMVKLPFRREVVERRADH